LDDENGAAARTLEALARCDRRFFRALVELRGRRPEVTEVRRDVTLRVLEGGGGRAELGLEALLTETGRAAYWQLHAEWTAAGWALAAHAFASVRGRPVPLRPTERWAGTAVAEFAAVADRAAAALVENMGAAELVSPAPALAAAAARLVAPEEGPPVLLGVPRAELVRAYVLDGMPEDEAARFVDAMLASGSTRPIPGGRQYFGLEDLVPLARLGPPLADALRTRLERDVADTRRLLAEEEALLARVLAIAPAAG
jgi:hypothetical protein